MMKATFTKVLLMACAAIFAINVASAQTVFWNEDFSSVSDLPTGWTSEAANGTAAVWGWCDDPSATNPCILNWSTYSNQHDMNFSAATADNGFVYMDSDGLGAADHDIRLTSTAIDCSGQTDVWVKSEHLVGVFGTATTDNVVLRVSTDNMNWTSFNLFDIAAGNTGNEPGSIRWSLNPDISLVDISSVAAGSSTVYLQWQWIGNYEYYWLIDDLELYDADPTSLFIAAFDLRVNNNFFAIAPNAQTPASQVEQFGFLADIENIGFQDQTGVTLNLTIVDDATSAAVYSEDLIYGTVEADSLVENVLFNDAGFTPAGTPGTTYTGTYAISADSIDTEPDNNVRVFDFAVTDTLYAKEMGSTRFITPAASNWDDGEPHSWAYGNCFYFPNGDGYFARYGSFTVGNAEDVAGRLITIFLYQWVDANEDGNADPDERTPIGFNFYEIQGTELSTDILTLPFLDFSTNEIGALPLADNTNYIVMLEYSTVDDVDFTMMASEAYDYGAQAFRSEELLTPRYGSMLGINGDLTTEPYGSTGFGRDIVPVVRLGIGTEPLFLNTNDILSDDNKITVTPNPAETFINLNFDLVESHNDAIVRIMDVTGKVITERVYSNVQNDTFKYNVSNYAAGTYFAHFISEGGSKTVQFIVTK